MVRWLSFDFMKIIYAGLICIGNACPRACYIYMLEITRIVYKLKHEFEELITPLFISLVVLINLIFRYILSSYFLQLFFSVRYSINYIIFLSCLKFICLNKYRVSRSVFSRIQFNFMTNVRTYS